MFARRIGDTPVSFWCDERNGWLRGELVAFTCPVCEGRGRAQAVAAGKVNTREPMRDVAETLLEKAGVEGDRYTRRR